jgi:hypothetical protein
MQNGELFRQQTLVRPIEGNGSGLLPTPRSGDVADKAGSNATLKNGRLVRESGENFSVSLATMAAMNMWPTTRAASPGSRPNGKGGKILAEEVAIAEGLRERGRPAKAREGGTLIEALSARTLWPTPTASDNRPRGTQNSTARRMALGKQVGLEAMVKWATPTAHNAKEAACPAEYLRATPTLAAQAGGSLNPTWVEWLMGWPLGWTDLKPLETDKFPQWLQQHGAC